jgi:hypothetical protein
MRISSIGLIAAVSLGLGGCAYNGLGMGVGTGYGYDGYPYGYDRYAYGGYNPYGYNPYGAPYGWYNGYYYPGSGQWVYDRDGRRREISRDEQAHFGRLKEVFRDAVDQRSRNLTTSPSSGAPVATTARVRESQTRQPTTRSERRSTRGEQSRKGFRILGVRPDRRDD